MTRGQHAIQDRSTRRNRRRAALISFFLISRFRVGQDAELRRFVYVLDFDEFLVTEMMLAGILELINGTSLIF